MLPAYDDNFISSKSWKMFNLRKLNNYLGRPKALPQHWPQDWKRSVFIPIPKKENAKECSNDCTIALNSHASKEILKILQARQWHPTPVLLPGKSHRWRSLAGYCLKSHKESDMTVTNG